MTLSSSPDSSAEFRSPLDSVIADIVVREERRIRPEERMRLRTHNAALEALLERGGLAVTVAQRWFSLQDEIDSLVDDLARDVAINDVNRLTEVGDLKRRQDCLLGL